MSRKHAPQAAEKILGMTAQEAGQPVTNCSVSEACEPTGLRIQLQRAPVLLAPS